MVDLKTPIPELVAGIRSGKWSAVELVEAGLKRIEETREFHTVLEINPKATEQAKDLDRRVKAGETNLPLAGIPYIAKDNYLTKNTHTTAASHILEPFEAPYEGQVIKLLTEAGAILLAKANLDAFAHGSSTENSDFGPTKNPHDNTRVPGGSSGGSAASVALGQACFATGTDTGSSVRLPASFCGVVGLMPSYGLVSRNGVIAMGSSFDTMGAMANSVSDVALVLDTMAGPDPADSTTVNRAKTYLLPDQNSVKGLKFGLIKEYLAEGTDPETKNIIMDSVDKLRAAGAIVEEMSIPLVKLALGAYYILVPAEVSSNLARYDGVRYGHTSTKATNLEETYRLSREEGFGREAKRRIMIGTYVLSSGYYDAYYKRAQKVRTLLIEEFKKVFEKYDLLLGPVAPAPAFKLGDRAKDPVQMYLSDVCTVAVNLVGSCGISVPAGSVGNLPVGLQIIGPQQGEVKLLKAAAAAESLLA